MLPRTRVARETERLPVPECADDEILIRVDTAGVGVWDPWLREGGLAELLVGGPDFPYVLGADPHAPGTELLANLEALAIGCEAHA